LICNFDNKARLQITEFKILTVTEAYKELIILLSIPPAYI